MKIKKTELESRTATLESKFKLAGLIFAIADLIRALYEAEII
ncbi:hypothetical protein [Bacillus thuringiensis]|nr:hypothetical protein [Bacillus thuringiensis]